jgi:hypothetical protein
MFYSSVFAQVCSPLDEILAQNLSGFFSPEVVARIPRRPVCVPQMPPPTLPLLPNHATLEYKKEVVSLVQQRSPELRAFWNRGITKTGLLKIDILNSAIGILVL